MACKRCGHCCKVFMFESLDEDAAQFFELRGFEVHKGDIATGATAHIPCRALRYGPGGWECAIYETRPSTCRDYICEGAR